MTKAVPAARQILPITVSIVFACANAETAVRDYPFSGRWRIDTTSFKGNIKPTVIKLIHGGFKRDDNPVTKADGRFHSVLSDGYVDEQSISVESDHVIREIDKIRGKIVYIVDYTVSADGDNLTSYVTSYTSPNRQAVRSETIQRRVGLAEKGLHLVSGKWERVGMTVGSQNDWTLKLDGNRFSSRTDGRIGYDAMIGGAAVIIDGDNSGARSKITRPQPDIIVETMLSAKGERDALMSMQLTPDGKTIRATATYNKGKTTTTFDLHRVDR